MVTVGVIGGGQLAWMMAPAAQALGIELRIQTPSLSDPAGAVIPHPNIVLAPIDDANGTATLAQQCDVITFENEFVDLPQLSALAETGVQFYPQIQSLQPLLDKYHQRQCFQQLGIPTPAFVVWEFGMDIAEILDLLNLAQSSEPSSEPSLQPSSQSQPQSPQPLSTQPLSTAADFPVVLKARRHGYDGKGTHMVKTVAELTNILTNQPDIPWLVEEFVPFERELAVMAARSPSGNITVYPVVETQQVQQVCRRVYVLPEWNQPIQQQVEAIAHKLLTHLDFVGILGIEFFLTAEGQVLVNEIAPRPHNSGHYTIDACATSQFEQQLRAVTGLPLAPVHLNCAAAVMVNLLGYEDSEQRYQSQRSQLAALPQTKVYWYGKSECRLGRKMGHVTATIPHAVTHQDSTTMRQQLEAIATHIEQIWYGSDYVSDPIKPELL